MRNPRCIDSPVTMGRRRFVELATGACAALVLPSCASVIMARLPRVDGTVRLSLRDYPQLAHPGGYLKVMPEGASTPVYILALDDRHVALSPVCTHLGCIVNVEGAWLVCPCHGSTYSRTGAVVRGPAERALQQLPLTRSDDGTLIVQLENSP